MMCSFRRRRLGRHIRETRARRKLSLRELARRIKCSPTYLSLLERDKLDGHASARVLGAIAKALSIDAYTLYQRAGVVPEEWRELFFARPEVAKALLQW